MSTWIVIEYILKSMVIALGSIVQGVLGFGSSIVWMAFFPFLIEKFSSQEDNSSNSVQISVGILQPLAHTLNAIILCQGWEKFTTIALNSSSFLKSDILPIVLSIPIGIWFGIWILTTWSPPSINGLLGGFILFYVWYNRDEFRSGDNNTLETDDNKIELVPLSGKNCNNDVVSSSIIYQSDNDILEKDGSLSMSSFSSIVDYLKSVIAGFLGGCFTSAFGTGGPPILIHAKERGWDKVDPNYFRTNLQIIFFYWNILTNINLYFYQHIINSNTLRVSLMLSPAMILGGIFGSTTLASRINKITFKKLILIALTSMGILYLISALK